MSPLAMVKCPYNSALVTGHMGPQAKISSSRSEGGRLAIVFVPVSSCGWSPGHFLWCHHLDLLSLVATFPLVGGDVEGLRFRLHRPINCS
jgi:hypothetical protein